MSIGSIMFKTRDPAKANTKHLCLKHLSNCYINRTCSKLRIQWNCRKPLKSSVSGIRAPKDHKTATPFDRTDFKK